MQDTWWWFCLQRSFSPLRGGAASWDVATSTLGNVSSYMIWCPNKIFKNEMFYVDFETSEAQSSTQDLMLLSLVLVIICSHIVFHLWTLEHLIEQKKYHHFYFTKWEGNWGKSGELTYSSPHIRLAGSKTEPPVRLHPSSTKITGIAWVLRSSLSCE